MVIELFKDPTLRLKCDYLIVELFQACPDLFSSCYTVQTLSGLIPGHGGNRIIHRDQIMIYQILFGGDFRDRAEMIMQPFFLFIYGFNRAVMLKSLKAPLLFV